jgi:hypothetical protein
LGKEQIVLKSVGVNSVERGGFIYVPLISTAKDDFLKKKAVLYEESKSFH